MPDRFLRPRSTESSRNHCGNRRRNEAGEVQGLAWIPTSTPALASCRTKQTRKQRTCSLSTRPGWFSTLASALRRALSRRNRHHTPIPSAKLTGYTGRNWQRTRGNPECLTTELSTEIDVSFRAAICIVENRLLHLLHRQVRMASWR